MNLKVQYRAGGTLVGGAVFSVREKWKPWQVATWVFAKEERQQTFVEPLVWGAVNMNQARNAVFRWLGR